jgi:RHS repeat-associated protein
LEENHYYPFGLTQAGISDKAIKTQYAENKYRYNEGSELQNKEFSDGTGLELYETNFRSYDQQVGRFFQEDPMAGQTPSLSSYEYAADDPTLMNDPTGLMPNKMNPELNPVVTSSGGFDDGTGIMQSILGQFAQEDGAGMGTSPVLTQAQNGLTQYSVDANGNMTQTFYDADPTTGWFNGNMGIWTNYVTSTDGGQTNSVTDHHLFIAGGFGDIGDNWGVFNGYGMFEGESGDNIPEIGNTTTSKTSHEDVLFDSGLGDKLVHKTYYGVRSGTEGSLWTTDNSSDNKEFEGQSYTIGGFTFGWSADISLTVGFDTGNVTEWHGTIGIGHGLGMLGLGHSTAQGNQVNGEDYTYTIGIGTQAAGVVADYAVLILAL